MQLRTNQHSIFRLNYHLVMCVKYRNKVINDQISNRLKKEFPELRKQLWKEYFWAQSFCLMSVGDAPLEVIRNYILEQGKNK